jgi:hypothetical protein
MRSDEVKPHFPKHQGNVCGAAAAGFTTFLNIKAATATSFFRTLSEKFELADHLR